MESKQWKHNWTLEDLEKDDCRAVMDYVRNSFCGHRTIDCWDTCSCTALRKYRNKYPEKYREQIIADDMERIEQMKQDINLIEKEVQRLKTMPLEIFQKGTSTYFGNFDISKCTP